jgi:hypothetical protein
MSWEVDIDPWLDCDCDCAGVGGISAAWLVGPLRGRSGGVSDGIDRCLETIVTGGKYSSNDGEDLLV